MFLTINKNSLILGAAAVLLCVIAAVILIKLETEPSAMTAAEVGGKVIVIDPGHGGVDGGASSGEILEKDLNLSVALKLGSMINDDGNTAIMTRDDDSAHLSDNGKFVKKDDLEHRLSFIESAGAKMFISIHMNKFDDPKYSGAQVFYSENGDDSRRLGELLQQSLKDRLDASNNRAAKGNENGVYILKKATVPAVIVECGFLSNPDELARLVDDSYQNDIAEAIYEGIKQYWEQEE